MIWPMHSHSSFCLEEQQKEYHNHANPMPRMSG
jgi:hypothetical protein